MLQVSPEVKEIIHVIENNLPERVYSDEWNNNDVGWEMSACIRKELQIDCEVFEGCSKSVLVPDKKDMNVIVKIPFDSWCFEIYDEDDQPTSETYYEEFCGARNSQNNWDYCRTEMEIYNDAVFEGVEMFFAETALVGFSKHNHPIYVQEYVEHNFGCAGSAGLKSSQKAKEIVESDDKYLHSRFNQEWMGIAIDTYGQILVDSLLNFLEECNLYDFHEGNFGYREDGSPVIFDYSDWHEDF